MYSWDFTCEESADKSEHQFGYMVDSSLWDDTSFSTYCMIQVGHHEIGQ